jgi:hypothetical protein
VGVRKELHQVFTGCRLAQVKHFEGTYFPDNRESRNEAIKTSIIFEMLFNALLQKLNPSETCAFEELNLDLLFFSRDITPNSFLDDQLQC